MRIIGRYNFKKLNLAIHRDAGYFLTGLVVIYCLSGLALNHVDDWNPDFVITKRNIIIPDVLLQTPIDHEKVAAISRLADEPYYTLYDFPTATMMKIYYQNATMLVDLSEQRGAFEKLERRVIFFDANILHRNTVKSWKWAADILAVLLIAVNITGLMIVKGKNGFLGRGKWFFLAGLVPPMIAVLFYHFLQQ